MSHAVKTHVPGSIYVKKMRSGKEYLYYLPFKSEGKYLSSGLPFSKRNVKIVEGILEHHYKEYLLDSNKLAKNLDTSNNNNLSIIDKFQYFKNHLISKELSKRTIYEYQYTFEMIISDDYPVDFYMNEYINGRETRVYKIEKDVLAYISKTDHINNTINKNLRQLQVFINYLVDGNELPPINIYKKYKVNSQSKEIIPYSMEEAEKIFELAKTKDEILYLLLQLFYLTGGRLNEWLNAYFGVDPYNVDLKNKTITFRNKIRKDQSQTIPISKKVEEVLLRLKQLEEERDIYKNKVIPFSPESKSTIIRKINRIESQLGIKKKGRSTHGFRRLLATELFENEVPIDLIKDIMRHSSIDVTMKAYRKQDKKRIEEQLEKLNR